MKRKRPKTELEKLFDKAWRLQSQYVKKRDSDWRGYGKCCTCGQIIEAMTKKGHAGHYRHGYLDFHEKNVNLQCSGCNTYRNGELDKYSLFLTRKYGYEITEQLDKEFHAHKRKHETIGSKYTKSELEAIIAELNAKISKLSNA